MCAFAREHQLPEAGQVVVGPFCIPTDSQQNRRQRQPGHPRRRGSWNLTRAGTRPGLHGSRGFITESPPSLADFRLEAGRKGTEQAVVGASSPQATA